MTQDIYELIFRGLQAKYPGQPIGPRFQAVCAALDGGAGSGNFGHEGRPGKVGGSGEGVGQGSYGDRENRAKCGILTEEEAEKLIRSDWKTKIEKAWKSLPKSSNGIPYVTNGNIKVGVPHDFVGETKSELFKKSKSKEEKVAALWAVQNMSALFSIAKETEAQGDEHKRPGVKRIIRFETAFPLQIGEQMMAFTVKFTVREFEDGRKVLAPELLETNKGADLRLYAMSTKKKGTR